MNIEQLCHLNVSQRDELLQLLNEFSDRFSTKPGLCEVVELEINLRSDFVPIVYPWCTDRRLRNK